MKLEDKTIKELHQNFTKKVISVREATEYFLSKIEKEDSKIGSFLEVFKEEALQEAERIDKLLSQNESISLLAGIPGAIKDNILVKDKRCTAGSQILLHYIAPYNATVVEKLKKENSIILGKTNLDEFAIGSSGEYSSFYPTKNPRNLEYVPGGSSSGSAAAVSAGFCLYSLGSDTGGSVRQPASFCGIVGLKPTYGRVSRFGLIAMASSLDQIGPFGKTVEDVEIVFNVIKGKDENDATSCNEPKLTLKEDPKEYIIGIPEEYFGEGIQEEVRSLIEKRIQELADSGIKLEKISLPHSKYALPCYYIIMTAEVSSNLARYDGIKYGNSKIREAGNQLKDLLEVYFETRKEFLGVEVKRRIMLGTYCLSRGYYEAYYLRAQKVRTKIIEDFEKAFQKVDLILTPTSPTLPFKFGERMQNPLSMYMADLLTVPINLAGLPAISIPAGEVDGLPVGIQLIAPHFYEKHLFQFGKLCEKIWHKI